MFETFRFSLCLKRKIRVCSCFVYVLCSVYVLSMFCLCLYFYICLVGFASFHFILSKVWLA